MNSLAHARINVRHRSRSLADKKNGSLRSCPLISKSKSRSLNLQDFDGAKSPVAPMPPMRVPVTAAIVGVRTTIVCWSITTIVGGAIATTIVSRTIATIVDRPVRSVTRAVIPVRSVIRTRRRERGPFCLVSKKDGNDDVPDRRDVGQNR